MQRHRRSRADQHFNPRTSCEVRRKPRKRNMIQRNFNPRTSCEVRLAIGTGNTTKFRISIHAPLARCDIHAKLCIPANSYFNPRTSCEVRPKQNALSCWQKYFNPRTSCEVRQCINDRILPLIYISIHAPLARCD